MLASHDRLYPPTGIVPCREQRGDGLNTTPWLERLRSGYPTRTACIVGVTILTQRGRADVLSMIELSRLPNAPKSLEIYCALFTPSV
jgi:hypothetical protein